MPTPDPKIAITEYASLPLGVVQPSAPLPSHLRGWVGEMRVSGGMGARPGTVLFLQKREIPHRQIHEISYEDEAGELHHALFCAEERQPGHWQVGGGAGIGSAKNSPVRNHPWVNLTGGGWEDQFWAGGRVLDKGLGVIRVRLISPNGQVLEDRVQGDLVLFITDQRIQVPVQVELYDHAGNLVGTHFCFNV